VPLARIQRIELDPFGRLGDVDRSNDGMSITPGTQGVMER